MRKFCLTAFVVGMMVVAFGADLFGQTRIRFAPGRTSTSVSGVLGGGATKTYVLGAKYGQYLSGNVSSSGDCVKFTEGSTTIGFTTRSGNNYVSVTNYCRRTVSFILTISINYGSD